MSDDPTTNGAPPKEPTPVGPFVAIVIVITLLLIGGALFLVKQVHQWQSQQAASAASA